MLVVGHNPISKHESGGVPPNFYLTTGEQGADDTEAALLASAGLTGVIKGDISEVSTADTSHAPASSLLNDNPGGGTCL